MAGRGRRRGRERREELNQLVEIQAARLHRELTPASGKIGDGARSHELRDVGPRVEPLDVQPVAGIRKIGVHDHGSRPGRQGYVAQRNRADGVYRERER